MAFKMKGNPMQRNFGIGGPMKKNEGKVVKGKKTYTYEEDDPYTSGENMQRAKTTREGKRRTVRKEKLYDTQTGQYYKSKEVIKKNPKKAGTSEEFKSYKSKSKGQKEDRYGRMQKYKDSLKETYKPGDKDYGVPEKKSKTKNISERKKMRTQVKAKKKLARGAKKAGTEAHRIYNPFK